jgi:hypothetical protein
MFIAPVSALLLTALVATTSGPWQILADGLELGGFPSPALSVPDDRITVLRIDPRLWELTLVAMSSSGQARPQTARSWCQIYGLTAAINAGMFASDMCTHLGYARCGDHVNNGRVNTYQSIAAFDPLPDCDVPAFRIFDLDAPGVTLANIARDYGAIVQNLRLIKRDAENRWRPQAKRWSEAALGEDDQGRVLFIFVRSALTMHDLNDELIALGIGIVAAQHLEGGPEAQFYLHIGDVEREQVGSYETGFTEHDRNTTAWPVPTVLGIRPRANAAP